MHSYEKCFGRKVNRMLLISPIVREAERKLAHSLEIKVYSDAPKSSLKQSISQDRSELSFQPLI